MVECPVCKGKGALDHQPEGGCRCCDGYGDITQEKAEGLIRIKQELKDKLAVPEKI